MQKRMSDLMGKSRRAGKGVRKPLAHVHETDDAVVVMGHAWGDNKEIDITIQTMSCVWWREKARDRGAEKDYHKRERTYKRFERRVSLPCERQDGGGKARLAEGVLEVTLPKVVIVSRKRISIRLT